MWIRRMGYSMPWDGDFISCRSADYKGKAFLTWKVFPSAVHAFQTERWQRLAGDTLKKCFLPRRTINYAKPGRSRDSEFEERTWVMTRIHARYSENQGI